MNKTTKTTKYMIETCVGLIALAVSFSSNANEKPLQDEHTIVKISQQNIKNDKHPLGIFNTINSQSTDRKQDIIANPFTLQSNYNETGDSKELTSQSSTSPQELVIKETCLFMPHSLENSQVTFFNGEFYVTKEASKVKIERHNLSSELRGIKENQLQAFLNGGYLSLRKIEDEYALTAKMRLRGGGPIAGAIAYWVTKSVCYGTAVAAAGTAVVATGGAAGAVMGGAAAAATLGAGAGATVVGGAIAGAGLSATAATTTAAVVAGAGGIAGAVAAVESASLGAGCFFTLIPFLP